METHLGITHDSSAQTSLYIPNNPRPPPALPAMSESYAKGMRNQGFCDPRRERGGIEEADGRHEIGEEKKEQLAMEPSLWPFTGSPQRSIDRLVKLNQEVGFGFLSGLRKGNLGDKGERESSLFAEHSCVFILYEH